MKNTATLTKWGNSYGIRIPKELIKMSHIYPGEEFNIALKPNGSFLLTPLSSPRTNWTQSFNQAIAEDEADLSANLKHSFDEEEWTW